MEYTYKITAEFNDAKACVETNKVRDAIGEFFNQAKGGGKVEMTSNLTGEILMSAAPNQEPYVDSEFELTLLGYFTEEDLQAGRMPFSDCTPVTVPFSDCTAPVTIPY